MNSTGSGMPIVRCIPGYKEYALGIPTPLAILLTAPISVAGTLLNAFALVLLASQKQFTNQDLYVASLSAFGMVMAGPCLFLFVYGNVKQCYDFPQIVSDLRIFLVQLSAGVSIWLVVMISVDRLMMLYFKMNYPTKVTKCSTIVGILSVIAWYVFICGSIDASPYLYGVNREKPLQLHPRFVMVASFVESPTPLSYALNLMRMVTDRILPWIMCTTTYIAILCVRDRQKRKMYPNQPSTSSTPLTAAQLFSSSPKIPKPPLPSRSSRQNLLDQQKKKSQILVIGITVSLFVCLTPETIFDISSYIFGVSLRKGVWEVFGVAWYTLTILNPVIYIASIPNLRLNAKQLLKNVGNRASDLWSENVACSKTRVVALSK